MNARKARELRRIVYGDRSFRAKRYSFERDPRANKKKEKGVPIVADKLRRAYQSLKKEGRHGTP